MNLYILNGVLSDHTEGMCVIAAESLTSCRQIFVEEFTCPDDPDYVIECMRKDFDTAGIKVIDNIPHEQEKVISYVYGGG